MTERLETLRVAILDLLCSADGETKTIHDLEPTMKELLTLAYREEKVTGPIRMCGTSCTGDCETCKSFGTLLDQHFAKEVK